MSLKPVKKSDLEKDWMKKRRDKRIRIHPEYHLIVTEGEKTEPQYFQAIKETVNKKYRDKIQLDVYGEGKSTLGLLEQAQRRAERSPNGYKHVWVVYDTDDFPADHVNRTDERCKELSTEETRYHAIWSNQCIELWYLLHFSYFQADIHRREYWPKLSEWLIQIGAGEYSKSRPDMYAVLRPYMDLAIANAERLDKKNAGKSPASAAPGTKVYEIVKALRIYLLEE